MELIAQILLILVSAYLYRLGGGNIWPFKNGFKPSRRYILPAMLFAYVWFFGSLLIRTQAFFGLLAFSAITHFGLQYIEDRSLGWLILYGLAQTACFWPISGLRSLLSGITWVLVVLLSNLGLKGLKLSKNDYRLDWAYAEAIQGAAIGLCTIL